MNRRMFLKRGAAIGLGLAAGRNLFGAEAPSNRVRVAVMGCHAKGRGFVLMRTAAGLPGVEIATVCDVDVRGRDAAAAEIKKLTGKEPAQAVDIRRVLEDKTIDGIICAAPDHWHAPAAALAMKAGKAIYVEKPCCHNPREGEMLVEIAKSTGAVFQMGSQRRASDVYRAAVAAIRDGAIGEPRYAKTWYLTKRLPIGKGQKTAVPDWLNWDLWQGPAPRQDYQDNVVHYNWHWFKRWGTGESGNNATHFVDVARWAMGVDCPERVTCGGGRLFYDGDDWEWYDTQMASFEFPGKKFMTWEGLTSVNSCPYEGCFTGCVVFGLKGSILFAPNDTCKQFDEADKVVKDWSPKMFAAGAANRTDPTSNLDAAHMSKWVDCIRAKDSATFAPAPQAVASTLLTHLANIALETGETVRLDPTTGKLLSPSGAKALWGREYEPGWEMTV